MELPKHFPKIKELATQWATIARIHSVNGELIPLGEWATDPNTFTKKDMEALQDTKACIGDQETQVSQLHMPMEERTYLPNGKNSLTNSSITKAPPSRTTKECTSSWMHKTNMSQSHANK